MPEGHSVVDRQKRLELVGRRGVALDVELVGGLPEQRGVPQGFGGRHQHQQARLIWQLRRPREKGLLEAAGQRLSHPGCGPSDQLLGRPPARELEQGEGVATSLGHDASDNQ